jgi:hypothetical protein
MLLLVNNAFVQVIEGPHMHMDTLFRRITTDPRHSGVQCLVREEITARHFPDWSMGFRQIEVSDAQGARAFALTQSALRNRLSASDVEALSSLVDALCGANASSFSRKASA